MIANTIVNTIEKSFIVLLLFLISINVSLAAVEIVIEYNVTSECSGNVALALTPQSVIHGGLVTPSASGLSSCSEKAVSFRSNSCSGTQVSSCTVDGGSGCTGSPFSAESIVGTYTYYACVDKNGNNNFADAGESDSKVLTVEESKPSVGPPAFSSLTDGGLDLIASSRTMLKISATITNQDGASNVSSCSGYLWNASITAPYTAAKASYTNSSCLLSGCSGTTCQCECSFNLWYYDIPGTWAGNVTATTKGNKLGANQSTFVVNPLTSIDVANAYGTINSSNPYPIVFGTLKVGDVNREATSNPLKVINTGNVKLECYISGDDHIGANDTNWVIKVGNMTYNSTASGLTSLRPLTNTPTGFLPTGGIPAYPTSISGVAERGTFYINNYLSIPAGYKAQTYKSTYYLDVEAI